MDPPLTPHGFTLQQVQRLNSVLDRQIVKTRNQGGSQVSYIEGWHAIDEANQIFGFDSWNRETFDMRFVSEKECKIGKEPQKPGDRPQRDGWSVTYLCLVRVTVRAGITVIVREGCGCGHGIDVSLGQAHESASKEAETDAMKRALMTFGNPFGLALYDKDKRNVGDPALGLLQDKALQAMRKAGLTDYGICNLCLEYGTSESIEGLQVDILDTIVTKGLTSETIARCNGDEPEGTNG